MIKQYQSFNYFIMKRGKRQIIERANIFGEDQQADNSQSQFTTLAQQQMPIFTHTQTTSIKNTQPYHIQKPLVSMPSNKTEESKDNGGDNDERKKRLDMLKQKYLKKGETSTVQGTDVNSGNKLSDEHGSMVKARTEKIGISSTKTNESLINSYFNQSQDKDRKINKPKQVEDNQNIPQNHYSQNEDSTEKLQEDVKVENRRVVPPPPPSMAGRKRVPPPPVSSKIAMGESKIQQNSFNNEHIPEKNSQRIKTDTISEQLQAVNNPVSKVPPVRPAYQPKLKQPSYEQQERSNTSLVEQLQKWLQPTSSLVNPKPNDTILSQILSQLSGQHTNLMSGLIQNFLLNNTGIYSQQQSDFVIQTFDGLQLGLWSRIVLAVKCGAKGLKGLQRKGIRLEQNLGQLVNVMQFLNEGQRDRLVGYILRQNFQLTSVNIIDLCKLSINTQGLGSVVMKHTFENAVDAVKILKQMKCQVTDQNSEVYFGLISKILGEIESSQILQKILQQISPIQGAYQYKKQLKLKIIQKIDSFQRNTKESKFEIPFDGNKKKEADSQKGNGINLMGYFNQAIKKIKSQIPEKTSSEQADNNEVSQNVVYDPVLKRYLLNGKLPDDENGGAQEQKQGKKPPPPPPRAGKNNVKANDHKEDSKRDEEQERREHQDERAVAENQVGFKAQRETTDNSIKSKLPPPPPPRIGLKGMGGRKPKIQASYN